MKIYTTLLTVLLLLVTQPSSASEFEDKLASHAQWLRSVKAPVDRSVVKAYRKKAGAFWKEIAKNKKQNLTAITAYLGNELQKSKPSPLVLLDLAGYLAHSAIKGGKVDAGILDIVMQKLDVKMPVIDGFASVYYRVVISYAGMGTDSSLPILDKILLPNRQNSFKVYRSEWGMHINVALVHSFGVHGKKVIPYLLGQLRKGMNVNRKQRILKALRNMCTAQCNQKVYALVKDGGIPHKTLVHAGFILLDTGGPKGRDLFLSLDPSKFSKESAAWLNEEFAYAKKLDYQYYLTKFEKQHAKDLRIYTDSQFLVKLKRMPRNLREFLEGHPHDFTNSGIERKVLIEYLQKIRQRFYWVVNIHNNEYVSQVNQIINALYYKK